jgi:carbamoyl-phosphate synthase small subunit
VLQVLEEDVSDTILILADGKLFGGKGFGEPAPTIDCLLNMGYDEAPIGEIVFNTTMGAYHEIMTDPSYAGQSVVMTSVHIGNYGMDEAWTESLDRLPHCSALIVKDLYDGPLPKGRIPVSTWCVQHSLCGLEDLDTRSLTRHIRDEGSMYGVLVKNDGLDDRLIAKVIEWISSCPPMHERDFVGKVAIRNPQVYIPEVRKTGTYALWDFGTKHSIIAQLLAHGIEVHVFPCTIDLHEFLGEGHRFDALFLSNGPGDPDTLSQYVAQLRLHVANIPLLGICLGHQLLAKALGARTERMLFGHHGGNHPVRDLLDGRVYVTAQNHGYCVDTRTLPSSTVQWLVNDNDKTLEGLFDEKLRVMSVQFHPEAAPGPWEARKLFSRFMEFVDEMHGEGGCHGC